FRLEDITRDEVGKGPPRKIGDPIAQAYFYRGQKPLRSTIGDTVENDLASTIKVIEEGWIKPPYWSLVLLDLCFYTGKVTKESDRQSTGMPEGRLGDDDPKQYFGLKILSAIKENFPNLPVVVLSSKPEQEVGLDYTRRDRRLLQGIDDCPSKHTASLCPRRQAKYPVQGGNRDR
ncbi:MAG: hypothetical protein JRE23_11400, partial [Deltaproteobacteria bacterium]|nr:hypothetical protein [Deltaproteobacteria bacterium]